MRQSIQVQNGSGAVVVAVAVHPSLVTRPRCWSTAERRGVVVMAEQPALPDSEAVFTVVSSTIPAGVRCGSCGRLHLPGRLRAIDDGNGQGERTASSLVVRCSRCPTVGPLLIDETDSDEVTIRDAIAASAPRRSTTLGEEERSNP